MVFLKIEWKISPLSIEGIGNLYISLPLGFTIYGCFLRARKFGIYSFSSLSLKKWCSSVKKRKKILFDSSLSHLSIYLPSTLELLYLPYQPQNIISTLASGFCCCLYCSPSFLSMRVCYCVFLSLSRWVFDHHFTFLKFSFLNLLYPSVQ